MRTSILQLPAALAGITLAALLPLRCAVCDEVCGEVCGEVGGAVTGEVCGAMEPGSGGPRSGSGLCAACAARRRPAPMPAPPPGLDACLAVHSYEGVVRREVLAMKAAGRHGALHSMAVAMEGILRPFLTAPTVLTWAPTTPQRRRSRGFDQAEELARALARASGLGVAPILHRTTPSAQHGSDRAHRSAVAFVARPLFPVGCWPQVVIVDDVRTTGATFAAAARAIRDRGGEKIIGIAYASTPHRR